jgi:DNA-binding NarL/FixJ family response regulator
VQHILTKLDVHSRVEIARQAMENLELRGESA